MKKLKIVAPGFDGYTGNLGGIDFVDGVSVDPVPRIFANRLSAAMMMVEIDDGSEVDASVAYRLIAESESRAPVLEELPRQTEEEKTEENVEMVKRANLSDVVILSRDELEALLAKDGIKGLRDIAKPWGVKERNAVALIELILEAQSKFVSERDARIALAAGESKEPPAEDIGDTGDAAAPEEAEVKEQAE